MKHIQVDSESVRFLFDKLDCVSESASLDQFKEGDMVLIHTPSPFPMVSLTISLLFIKRIDKENDHIFNILSPVSLFYIPNFSRVSISENECVQYVNPPLFSEYKRIPDAMLGLTIPILNKAVGCSKSMRLVRHALLNRLGRRVSC